MLDYFSKLNQKDIWSIAQNRPTLIVKDLEVYGVDKNISYSILLARGVFKWLAARRDIIKLKDLIKVEVKNSLGKIREIKAILKQTPDFQNYHNELYYWRGYLKAKEEDRAAIREICHSERFRAPDFDKNSNEFLDFLIDKEIK